MLKSISFLTGFISLFQKDSQNSEVQKFVFNDKILALYKVIISSRRSSRSKSSTENSDTFVNLEKSVYEIGDETNRSSQENKKEFQNYVCKKSNLEGCILVQRDSVWECRLR